MKHKYRNVEWDKRQSMIRKYHRVYHNDSQFSTQVGLVWNLVSSLGSVQILYILPPAFYLKIRFDRYKQRSKLNNITICSQYTCTAVLRELTAWVILFVAVLLLIVGCYQSVYNLVESGNAGAVLCAPIQCTERNGTSV